MADDIPALKTNLENIRDCEWHRNQTGIVRNGRLQYARTRVCPNLTRGLRISWHIRKVESRYIGFLRYITAQIINQECRIAALTVKLLKTTAYCYSDVVLVSVLPVDGASQRRVPAVLRHGVLHSRHHVVIVEQSGEPGICDAIWRKVYWPRKANDVNTTVRDCRSCARWRRTTKSPRELRLLAPSELLEFVAFYVYSTLPKTNVAPVSRW